MRNFFEVLRNRNFLYLWLCEAFSQIAMNMMNFILILAAFEITSSNKAVSGIILSFSIPAVVFGIIAGAIVDHLNKKRVLFITNLIRFVFILFLAFFFKNIFIIYIVSFLSAIVAQFFIPAETPMIPLTVKKEQLLAANGLFSFALFGSLFLAYGMSGSFILLFNFQNSLLLLSLIYLIAAIFALLVKVKENKNSTSKIKINFNLIDDTKATLKTLISKGEIYHAFLLLVLIQVLTLIISVLGPGYAREILHININAFPIFFLTPAVAGMLIGSIFISNFLSGYSRHKIATLGLFMAAICIILMPYVVQHAFLKDIRFVLFNSFNIDTLKILVSISLAFCLGFANSLVVIPSNTLIQEHTSDAIRGKVYGALNSISSLFSIVPVILAGTISDIFGVGISLVALGIIIFIIAVARLTI